MARKTNAPVRSDPEPMVTRKSNPDSFSVWFGWSPHLQHDVSSRSIACPPYPDCQLKSRGFPRGPRQVLEQFPQIPVVGSCDGWDIGILVTSTTSILTKSVQPVLLGPPPTTLHRTMHSEPTQQCLTTRFMSLTTVGIAQCVHWVLSTKSTMIT